METPNVLPTPPIASPSASSAQPVEAMAEVLREVAAEPAAVLSSEIKQQQRAMLLAEAQKRMPAAVIEKAKEPSAPRTTRTWFALGGVSLAVACAALVLFIKAPTSPLNGVGVVQFEQINRLVIPVAQAETLFTVPVATALAAPEKSSQAHEEGLVIASSLPVTADQLRATIRVTPEVPLEVTPVAKAKNTFRIIPKTQTVTAASYRISVPTLVTNEDGSRTAREFTWSLQSDASLVVRSTIPAQAATDVPEDTGIEFALNHLVKGVVSSTITLTPPTPGRVEIHGQAVVFVPNAPLKAGTYYRARLAGVETADGLALAAPVEIAFETSLTDTQRDALARQITFASEFSEVSPQVEVRLGLYAAKSVASSTVEVVAYSLSPEQAQRLLEARTKLPTWSTVATQQDTDYATNATQEAFRLQTTLEQTPEAPGFSILRFPKGLDAGFYAIKLTVPGAEPRWAFIQATRIASYTVVDKKNVVVWTVNTETKKLLNHVLVQSPEGSALTNDQGIAELPAPAFLTEAAVPMPVEPPVRILSLQNDTDHAFVVLSGTQTLFRSYGDRASGLLTTWGYLFADRPLYHPSDELHLAGIVMDRETHTVPSDVRVQLRMASPFFDIMGQNTKIYQDHAVTLDASGRFEQTFKWDAMLPGYYSVVLTRAGEVVVQRALEIREFTKPAYAIDVVPAKTRQYADEKIQLAIRAHFYDGTSFPGATLKLTPMQGGVVQETVTLTLDSNGETQYAYQPQPIPCGSQQTEACHVMEPVEFEVRPVNAEEGEIVGTASVLVYATSMNVQLSQRVQGKTAIVSMKTLSRDIGAISEEKESVVPVPSVALEGLAIGYYYEAIPEGTYYDFIEKVTKPAYRYERRRDARPLPIGVQTNAQGEATYQFTMNPERDYYEVIVGGRDARGRAFRSLVTISRGWSDIRSIPASVNETPNLVFTDVQPGHTFNLGDHVAMQYVHGTTPLDASETPGIFVYTASRGIRDARIVTTNEVSLTFDERSLPNTEVHAVTFWKGRFESAQTTLLYRKDPKELQVTLEPVVATIKPGETAQVKVHVQKQDGSPAQATRIALAAVDASLYALTGPQTEDPLTALYETVPNGIEYTVVSHRDTELGGFGAGGGGMRSLAADGQAIRRLFKDTAAFSVVTLDEQGNGLFTFTAPDNLTSWRVTGVALNGALEAGAGTTDVRVAKPSFVEVVIPSRLLVSDAPVLQVRAFGTDLNASSTVRFTVTAPTLGLNNVELTGTAFAPAYVPISSPAAGTHKIIVRVQTERGEDAIEREVRVSSSFFTKQEFVTMDVAPGIGLPPLGIAQAEVILASTGRIELLPELQTIAHLEGIRLDTRVAREIARMMLRESYHQDLPSEAPGALLAYQSSVSGEGLKLLPYGSSDLVLSADVVSTAPNSFDRQVLSQVFYGVLASSASSRDEQIDALMGLASLQEPVVADLQVLATRTDLTDSQLLRVIRGLLRAGDQATAATLLERVLTKTLVEGGQRFLDAPRLVDRITYTTELAALAAELHRVEAPQLYAYVTSVWHDDAFPILAKIRYLRARLAALPIDNGEVTWTMNNGATTESILLKDEPVHVFTLTASEAKNFRIVRASGPARLSFVRRVVGRPNAVPGIALTRSYQAAQPINDLRIGTEVTVTLTPRLDREAREGCYLIRDHVPGGLQPVLQTKMDHRSYYANDFDPLTGEISFVSCKQSKVEPITYRTRIVAKGTYTAEAPVMEHLEYPSISTLGQDEVLTIK